MDLFFACVAFGPLAIYLVLLGLVNLSSRPVVTSGTRETLSLGLALSGLMIVGPMQLFMPEEAAGQFGGWVWGLLLGFYLLTVILVILLGRPRLIVYNATRESVESALTRVANRMDRDTRWAGHSLEMPSVHIELRVESFTPMHNVMLVGSSHDQSSHAWGKLAASLRGELAQTPIVSRACGLWLVFFGIVMLTALATRVVRDPQLIAQGLQKLLNP